MQTPNAVRLSGRVVTNKFEAQPGDVYVYSRDSGRGRVARTGRHTNFGYAGRYFGLVHDGAGLRRLRLTTIAPNTGFDYRYEAPGVLSGIQQAVASRAGALVRTNGTSLGL
jgi:hypothetical protein